MWLASGCLLKDKNELYWGYIGAFWDVCVHLSIYCCGFILLSISPQHFFRVIIRVIIKATTRATIAKETTTKATAMATTVNIQVMDKVTMTVKDLDNHITSKTTINSINRWVTRNVLWLKTTLATVCESICGSWKLFRFVLQITVLKASNLLLLVKSYKIVISLNYHTKGFIFWI